MKPKRYITFAGVGGSSKTPIAHYLSTAFGLPIFNNDAIRTEVKEDRGFFDIPEYDRRVAKRANDVLVSGISLIHDASIDRDWPTTKQKLADYGYTPFIISLNLSREFIAQLYHAKEYTQFDLLESWLHDHETFLSKHRDEVGLHISDTQFPDRLELAKDAVSHWLAQL